MIITLCVKCRCVTALVTEPIVNVKVITKDPTKFVAIVCAACNDDGAVENYNETITANNITSMQEWKYIMNYVSGQERVFNVNTVGDYVVVFNHNDVVPRTAKVVTSQPIITCKEHRFEVHRAAPVLRHWRDPPLVTQVVFEDGDESD